MNPEQFNQCPKECISDAYSSGLSIVDIVKLLRYSREYNPIHIGYILGEPDSFYLQLLQLYASEFKYEGMPLDIALRVFLGHFRLPGEAQKIDRILEAFARAYYMMNGEAYYSADIIYILTFSVVLLNTDAHNPHTLKKFKMTKEEYIRNHRGLNNGSDLPEELLIRMYESFTRFPIRYIPPKPLELQSTEIEITFTTEPLGLELETGFHGHGCVVKNSTKTSLVEWIITAVNNDKVDELNFEVIIWLIRIASRPILLRFSEPNAYYRAYSD